MMNLENELCRRDAVIAAQNEALAECRRKADEDAGLIARLRQEIINLQPLQHFESDPR